MSRLISGALLGWQRYWKRLGASDYIDWQSGFLTLSTSIFREQIDPDELVNSGIWPTSRLADFRFAVLHGKPGDGKSIELRQLYKDCEEREETSIFVDLTQVPTLEEFRRETVDSEIWRSWRDGDGVLTCFIDSLDEGLFRIGRILETLCRWLKDQSVDRLRLVIACRSADWPSAAGSELAAIVGAGEDYRFELCPLRYEDVMLAAASCEVGSDEFSEWVMSNRLTYLAASPLTLRMLLSEYQSNPSFNGSHFQLYSNFCYRLSGEWDPDRAREQDRIDGEASVTQEEVMALSSRMAAIQLVSGRVGYFNGAAVDECPESAFTKVNLSLANSESGDLREPRPNLIRATLATPLFRVSSDDCFTFDHRTFAEALGANFLADLSVPQLRGIFFDEGNSGPRVVPQLSELAAWVALGNGEFFDFLIANDPQALLKADVSQSQADRKSELVRAILDGAEEGSVFDDWSDWPNYSTLAHPGIAEQLKPILSDSSKNPVVRRIAFKLVAECKVTELRDQIWEVIDRDDEGDRAIVGAIADALRAMPGDGFEEDLLTKLAADISIDPEGEIKAAILSVLVPEFKSLGDVIGQLSPGCRTINGPYNTWLIFEAPKHLVLDDLCEVLQRLKTIHGCCSSGNVFQKLAGKALQLAVNHLDDQDVARSFVEFWITQGRSHYRLPRFVYEGETASGRSLEADPIVLRDQEHRREILRSLMDHSTMNAEALSFVLDRKVTEPSDLGFFLAEIENAEERVQVVLAELIDRYCWSDEFTKHWDQFLIVKASVPALEEKFSWFRPNDIESEIIPRAEAAAERDREFAAISVQNQRREKRLLFVNHWLGQAEAGLRGAWVGLAHVLCLSKNGGQSMSHTVLNLQKSEPWPYLSERVRSVIKTAARLHLNYNAPSSGTRHRSLQAIFLLKEQLQSDLKLRSLIVRKWLPTIAGCTPFFGKDRAELFFLVRRISPPEFDREFFRIVRMQAENREWLMQQDGLEGIWSESLTDHLASVLTSLPPSYDTIRSAFQFLNKVAPEQGERLLVEMVKLDQYDGFFFRPQRTVWAHLLVHFPAKHWDRIWEILEKYPAEVRPMFFENDHLFGYGNEVVCDHFSENQLASLYLLLYKKFPEEPVDNREGGAVHAIDQVQFFRSNCLKSLVSRGTQNACDELRKISDAVDGEDRIWLMWSLRDAERNRMRKDWIPIKPDSLLQLKSHAGMRVVNSEGALQEIVLESLARLQESLHGQNPAGHDFWNEPREQGGLGQPRSELTISTNVSRFLERDLIERGVVVNREVDVSTQDFADIHISSTSQQRGEIRKLSVVIEVKGCWHEKVKTSMESQLKGQYLHLSASRHGIYLVAWFPQDQWDDDDTRKASARRKCPDLSLSVSLFKDQAKQLSDGEILISSFVLDCSMR